MRTFLIVPAILLIAGCTGSADENPESPDPTETAETRFEAATQVGTQTPTAPASATPATIEPGPGELALVIDVVDGDTIDVLIGGVEDRVRLIGIDSPERGACYEDEATAALEGLVLDRNVTLEPDVEDDRDPFGRLLRYVHMNDVFINEELVRLGAAEATTRFPERAYREVLLAAEAEAKAEGRGLWSACPGLFE